MILINAYFALNQSLWFILTHILIIIPAYFVAIYIYLRNGWGGADVKIFTAICCSIGLSKELGIFLFILIIVSPIYFKAWKKFIINKVKLKQIPYVPIFLLSFLLINIMKW